MLASEHLADGYELLVEAVSAVPATQRELLLAKAVLLLAQRLDHIDDLRALLAAAARDLPAPTPEAES